MRTGTRTVVGDTWMRFIAHDLARLADHLPFFFGVAFLAGFPVVRQHVAGQLGDVRLRRRQRSRFGQSRAICASRSNRPVAPLPDDAW